jgi:hypothetical protein
LRPQGPFCSASLSYRALYQMHMSNAWECMYDGRRRLALYIKAANFVWLAGPLYRQSTAQDGIRRQPFCPTLWVNQSQTLPRYPSLSRRINAPLWFTYIGNARHLAKAKCNRARSPIAELISISCSPSFIAIHPHSRNSKTELPPVQH